MVDQSHLPAWIPLYTAFRLILIEIDARVGGAYELVHRRSGTAPMRHQALGIMEEASSEEAANKAWDLLLKALGEGAVSSTGTFSDTGKTDLIRPDDWTRLTPATSFQANRIDLANGTTIADVRIKTGDVGKLDIAASEPATAAGEKRAIQIVKALLQKDENLTKGRAMEALGNSVSKRGFDTRVWPDAREQAGLPRTAKAGKKPNRVP